MTVDLEGTSDGRLGAGQLRGGASPLHSAGRLQAAGSTRTTPPDGGSLPDALSVRVRPGGRLLAARGPPRRASWYFTPLGLLIDLAGPGPLRGATREETAAASYGDSMVIFDSRASTRARGRPWLDLEPTVGGWGAVGQGSDGQDGLINNVNGSLQGLPIEVFETKFPVRLGRYGFRPDSGGPGRHARRLRSIPRVPFADGLQPLLMVRALPHSGLGPRGRTSTPRDPRSLSRAAKGSRACSRSTTSRSTPGTSSQPTRAAEAVTATRSSAPRPRPPRRARGLRDAGRARSATTASFSATTYRWRPMRPRGAAGR